MSERHRERMVKREQVCISNLLFTPVCAAALAGSQKKTSPHYYFIHTRTHGSVVCGCVLSMVCRCAIVLSAQWRVFLRFNLIKKNEENILIRQRGALPDVCVFCLCSSAANSLLLYHKTQQGQGQAVTEETNRKQRQGN